MLVVFSVYSYYCILVNFIHMGVLVCEPWAHYIGPFEKEFNSSFISYKFWV